MGIQSEYEVERVFIERLQKMQYEYIEMKDYSDVLNNFRKQFCKLNKAVLRIHKVQ